ncbi:hypothetical protein LX16_4521 [Stackebrandtia albiflava]|uniref:Uncharacterized protein n=2 Tax=Stackebrandtia albiflava TaxID=406432 RepID=A0A562URQ4_9ACTN|nr:hypothetical protein LX16_4521 [Stackebrandtia albiflava]
MMAGFGLLWWLAGTGGLSAGVSPVLMGLGAVAAVVLFVASARRLNRTGEQEMFQRTGRVFMLVNLGQVAGIFVVVAVANLLDAQTWIPPMITVVVGIHFLPLAKAFGMPEFRWIAWIFVAVAVLGACLAAIGLPLPVTLGTVGIACALVLWGYVGWLLRIGPATAAGDR